MLLFRLGFALVALAASRSLEEAKLTSGGRQRTFAFYAPKDDGKPLPLVIALHGRLGQGRDQERLTGMAQIATREGFLLVYPDGIRRSWADAREATPASKEGVDDVRFVSDLIDEFVKSHHADPQRVFVTGISNGGMMSHTVGCRLGDKIAAIAPVAAQLPAKLATTCAPAKPVAVLMISGTEDPLVPYEGGDVKRGAGGPVLSADESIATWAKLDGCTQAPPDEALPDVDPKDGTTISQRRRTGCTGGTEATLDTVKGGGHTWPGGWQYLNESLVGKTSRDLNASEAIWAFFKAHGREVAPKAK